MESLQLQSSAVGVYGWRKRCLYFFVLLLLVLIVVNLGLTVWILVVIKFNIRGMGDLRTSYTGLRLEGRAEFTGPLYALDITSDQDTPLTIVSDRTVDIKAGRSELRMDETTIEILADSFQVHSPDSADSSLLFSVSPDAVSVAGQILEARGPLGAAFAGPVQTARLQSPPESSLRLEAPSGRLEVIGGRTAVSSKDLEMSSYGDILLTSNKITLNASLLNLRSVPISSPEGAGRLWEGVKELCVCRSGLVYTVEAMDSDGCRDDGGLCST